MSLDTRSLSARFFDNGSSAVRVSVGLASVPRFVLEVSLLHFGLVERLTIRAGARTKLEVRSSSIEWGEIEMGDGHWAVALSHRQLEVWLVYLLKFQRDSRAEVEHLDIELGEDGMGMLVLQADEFAPSVEPEEARKLLGLDD